MAYDRYKSFRQDGTITMVPYVEIKKQTSDFYITYHKGKDRLDKVSSDYYDDPDYGWLILQANPEYGALEFDIPDGAKIRVPYPLNSALQSYENGIEEYRTRN